MASPLDQQVYDDEPAYLEVKTFAGNDLGILITLPFDHTTYEFSGGVYDSFNTLITTFTTTKTTTNIGTELAPIYVYKVNYALTDTQTVLITAGSLMRFKWVQGGVTDRTFIAGPIEARTE